MEKQIALAEIAMLVAELVAVTWATRWGDAICRVEIFTDSRRRHHCLGVFRVHSDFSAASTTAPPASAQPLKPTVRWATLV